MSDLIMKARAFAIGAHEAVGHKRKYTGEPYWKHCEQVAHTTWNFSSSYVMTAAAWLHDTVEDTGVTLPTIVELFGLSVAALVADLTDEYTHEAFPHLNRAARKDLEAKRLLSVSNNAKTIKLADMLDNTRSIVQHDPEFAKVYMAEKRNVLDSLHGGRGQLWMTNYKIVTEYHANA